MFIPGTPLVLTKYQMSMTLKLLLGLPQTSSMQGRSLCLCGKQFVSNGAHQLCCKSWIAGCWKYGHDYVVQAIKKEIERCGITVDTSEKSLRRNFSHAGSELHGDAIVHTNGAIKVHDCIPRRNGSHDEFVYDVTIDAVVRGTGIWTGSRARQDDQTWTWKHSALQTAETQKYKKYEEGYANLSIGFLAFALSCFGVLGDSLVAFSLCWPVLNPESSTINAASRDFNR